MGRVSWVERGVGGLGSSVAKDVLGHGCIFEVARTRGGTGRRNNSGKRENARQRTLHEKAKRRVVRFRRKTLMQSVEEVMDYRTYSCARAKPCEKT